MDELIAWLRAQLDDDERAARAVESGPWTTVTIPDRSGPDVVLDLGGPDDRVVLTGYAEDDAVRPEEAEHIARWDPARVLAEVEAKRKLLDCLVGATGNGTSRLIANDEPWVIGSDYLVKLFAKPFAGRPGWREEWAA